MTYYNKSLHNIIEERSLHPSHQFEYRPAYRPAWQRQAGRRYSGPEALARIQEVRHWWRTDVYEAFLRAVVLSA